MLKKEKSRGLPVLIIVVAMTAAVLAGVIKEEALFVSSINTVEDVETASGNITLQRIPTDY